MGSWCMSAKRTDDQRVRELYNVLRETRDRVTHLGLTRDAFIKDASIEGRLAADALLMCVFRATEEAGAMSPETRAAYPDIYWPGIKTMRNILAHDYGSVDREAIWDSIEHDFPQLEAFCRSYIEDRGFKV